MNFEKISEGKFESFSDSQVAFPQAVYGGYRGETSTPTQSDQIKGNNTVDYTNHGSLKRNDGFS